MFDKNKDKQQINRIRRHWYGYHYDQGENNTDDVELLLGLIGQAPQSIFEVCCGTGRMLVPLAKAGHNVTGMDVDEGMLERIPAKAEGSDNLKYSLANAITADWGSNYDVVVLTENTLMNIEQRDDDKAAQLLFISKAADALKLGGHFFLVFNHYPEPEKVFNFDRDGKSGSSSMDDVGVSGQYFMYGGRYDPVTRIAVGASHLELTMPNGEKHIFPTHWHSYVCSRNDVHGWLNDSGFVIEQEFGGCDRRPFTGSPGWIIIWARKELI